MVLWVSIIVVFLSLAYVVYLFLQGRIGFYGPIIETRQSQIDDEVQRTTDEIDTLKASIKDLELEYSIGRVDKSTFEILRKEYLQKWLSLEKYAKENEQVLASATYEGGSTFRQEIPTQEKLKVNFCPNCGTKVSNPDADRYCAHCGGKLP